MIRLLRLAFFACIVRPLVLVVLGLHVRDRERLPSGGPAIIVANHNSHLDTLTLMSLFPLRLLPKLRPVAARDYFLKSRALEWFALQIIGILPLDRTVASRARHPLADCEAALADGAILILFPEGTRGVPEALAEFKRGIAHLARACPEVPVTPVFMHGLGKALPKGSTLLVPFNCDVFVGEPFRWAGSIDGFMDVLEERMKAMAGEARFPPWE
ncbi:MAG TPA: lysophospholipid acyltransferase family protein [Alphaproteobacteria bacterium]